METIEKVFLYKGIFYIYLGDKTQTQYFLISNDLILDHFNRAVVIPRGKTKDFWKKKDSYKLNDKEKIIARGALARARRYNSLEEFMDSFDTENILDSMPSGVSEYKKENIIETIQNNNLWNWEAISISEYEFKIKYDQPEEKLKSALKIDVEDISSVAYNIRFNIGWGYIADLAMKTAKSEYTLNKKEDFVDGIYCRIVIRQEEKFCRIQNIQLNYLVKILEKIQDKIKALLK